MCKLSQLARTPAAGGGHHFISLQQWPRNRFSALQQPLSNPCGLLNRRFLAAAAQGCSDAGGQLTSGTESDTPYFPPIGRRNQRPLEVFSGHGLHGPSSPVEHLWQRLCAASVTLPRLLAITVACCAASLLPRPAPSMAAAQSCTATVARVETCTRAAAPTPGADYTSCRQSPSSSDLLTPGVTVDGRAIAPYIKQAATTTSTRATPLADLAAASPAPLASLSSSTSLSTAPAPASRARLASVPDSLPASTAAQFQPLAEAGSSGAGGGGGAVAGPGSSATVSGGPGTTTTTTNSSSAAAAADPEVVALAQQLGLGVSEAATVRLFERNRASVVNISGMRAMQTFTTLDLAKMPYGQGSGFIWGDKGHVVTCYHLVKGAAEVKVTLNDNSSYTAKVLGYDAGKNIAVLKLSVPKSKLRELQSVTPGSAAGLRVGQTVYGIGNPWGLGHTMSQGLVCGLGMELSAGLFPIKGVLLTDAAADAGSSGGVLLDSAATLVGMLVTPPASSGGGGGAAGRSFAVPIDAVRGLINQILMYGRTVRPALGITMAPAQVLERVGGEGVLVLEVPPGSPAHAAGVRPTHRDIFGDLVLGDVIVGLDGKAVRSSADLYDILDEHRIGDRIKLDVVRDGKQTGLTVTLGERVLGAVEE